MYESAVHIFVVADYALAFTQNGTNFSSIKTNEHGLLNATLEDQDGLAAYILSVQNSSTDSWFNYSAAQITGNIKTFPQEAPADTPTGELHWKAIFHSDGPEQTQLDTVEVSYADSLFDLQAPVTGTTWRVGTQQMIH